MLLFNYVFSVPQKDDCFLQHTDSSLPFLMNNKFYKLFTINILQKNNFF